MIRITFEEAYDILNAIERQKISQAVCYGNDNPVKGEAREAFYNEIKKTDGADQYGIMEQMQEKLNYKIMDDNGY